MINSIHFLLFFLPKSNLIMHLIFFDDIRSSMPSRFLHHYELFIMKEWFLLCFRVLMLGRAILDLFIKVQSFDYRHTSCNYVSYDT
ncbi:hypothetical protein HanXRQr2_Chr12g0535991 [Helianthus annuus]|uniref:Uncharacterized protein n=1 Tax=Helianthus annuus TaxID=4232 RepID=A0A9K3HFQ9_HELAN|nr:hypothetical protein HanXRQr2_Chr12g0535991 [Helianthus annuus]